VGKTKKQNVRKGGDTLGKSTSYNKDVKEVEIFSKGTKTISAEEGLGAQTGQWAQER